MSPVARGIPTFEQRDRKYASEIELCCEDMSATPLGGGECGMKSVRDGAFLRTVTVVAACLGILVFHVTAGCNDQQADMVADAPNVEIAAETGGNSLNAPGRENLQVVLSAVTEGLSRPTNVASASDGSNRLFVCEQGGPLRIVEETGELLPEPFLDLSGVVNSTGEAGLLSVAFHPDYAANGRLFVNFVSDREGVARSYISQYQVDPGNPNRVDPNSERVLLRVDQPTYYHNGGLLLFGPDGYLWCGFGDGGHGTPESAQDNSNLLGTLVRIDIDNGDPYRIPRDNPFVDDDGSRDEIYAYGLRNPWRFAIDHETGSIFAADVGANDWEEINLVEAGGNYGWPMMEGTHCYPPGSECDATGLELPIHEYTIRNVSHCAIIGGEVYRGDSHPGLNGVYFFGDFCSGAIWSLAQRDGEWQADLELRSDLRISAFGTGEDGAMYVVDLTGGLYRMDFQPHQAD